MNDAIDHETNSKYTNRGSCGETGAARVGELAEGGGVFLTGGGGSSSSSKSSSYSSKSSSYSSSPAGDGFYREVMCE